MPEYLAPGVYVEETSFRSKSIEGVSTSTAGFVGPTRFGPISGQPELLVSFGDFERYYGDLEDLNYNNTDYVNFLALGVRSFFEEGGRRCYVTRVFNGDSVALAAKFDLAAAGANVPFSVLLSRFPGKLGNMRVSFSLKRGTNIFSVQKVLINNVPTDKNMLGRSLAGDVVYKDGTFYTVDGDGSDATPWQLVDTGGAKTAIAGLAKTTVILPISLVVSVERPTSTTSTGFGPAQSLGEFSLNADRPNGLTRVLTPHPKVRADELSIPVAVCTKEVVPNTAADTRYVEFNGNILELLTKLIPATLIVPGTPDKDPTNKKAIISNSFTLAGGGDGGVPTTTDYEGEEKTDTQEATGLKTFEATPDISIVAAPGYTAYERDQDAILGIHRALISHCELMRYRIAVLDTPERLTAIGALNFRNLTSSKYAAIYFPWVYISDPRPSKPGIPITRLKVPPSGLVAGIYARNDIEHAVFKAPANEVVREALDFEQRLSKGHQEVLNPEGVNCFRFFEGRGMLLWGARTITDDPEWKYVSLRRYFAYLERSIDRGTQWAVFENNGPALWANVRRTIEDFLYNEWRNGGLLGDKPEKAYFVRCDRSTMTQNDLDNGRLVCLIGVSPVRPAEFVIFRIGQWTADSQS